MAHFRCGVAGYLDTTGRYSCPLLKAHQLALRPTPHASWSDAAVHWLEMLTFGSDFGRKDRAGAICRRALKMNLRAGWK